MASRPTVSIATAEGKPSGASHPLPSVFAAPIRSDIVQYVKFDLETMWLFKMGDTDASSTGRCTPVWPRTSVSPTP